MPDNVAGAGADAVLELVAILMEGSKPGAGPFRLEDWNEWTDEQRRAYRALGHLVGLGDDSEDGGR